MSTEVNRVIKTVPMTPSRYQLADLQVRQLPLRSNSKKSKSKKNISRSSSRQKNRTKKTPQKGTMLLKNTPKTLSKQLLAKQSNEKTHTTSQDKTQKKGKIFVRTQTHDNIRSKSKRSIKRSMDSQNQQTMVEQLKAENHYYKQAYQTSKQSLQKMKKALDQEKQRRSTEKQLYQHEISSLKRKLSADKIQFGHIFTFDSFQAKGVSDMIVEVENESSTFSQMVVVRDELEVPEPTVSLASSLSVNSK